MTDVVLTAEAARVLDVVPATVRWLEKTGRLKAERTSGGTRLFRRADVLALARERKERRSTPSAVVPAIVGA
jgi:excisionase family DNA binding protein